MQQGRISVRTRIMRISTRNGYQLTVVGRWMVKYKFELGPGWRFQEHSS